MADENLGLMSMVDPRMLAELLARQGRQGLLPSPSEQMQRATPSDYVTQRYGTPFDNGLNELLGDDQANRIATGRTAGQQVEMWNKAANTTPGYTDPPTNFQKLIDALKRGARP